METPTGIEVFLVGWLIQHYANAAAVLVAGASLLAIAFTICLAMLDVWKRRLIAVMEHSQ